MNNDAMLYDYLLQVGAMRPEQDELKRKQAMVDALRQGAMTPQQGQMIGKHYVGPGIAGALGQLGQAYFAKQGQGEVNRAMSNPNFNPALPEGPNNVAGLNQRQRKMLEDLRRRSMLGQSSDMSMTGEGYL